MNSYNEYRYATTEHDVTGTRWAYDDEMQDSLLKLDLRDKHYEGCGLPVISDGTTAYVENGDSHSLIIGSTGSKKTRLFAMPMMNMIARAGESVVCTDPKGELFERTSGIFAAEGYKIKVINLRDPSRSNGWNPFMTARKYHEQGEDEKAVTLFNDLASSIITTDGIRSSQDPFWEQSAKAVFQGLANLVFELGDVIPDKFTNDHMNIMTMRTFADNLGNHNDDELPTNRIMKQLRRDSMARLNLEAITRSSEKTFDSIMVSYNAPVQSLYIQKSLINMLSTDDIDFDTLGTEKTALYIIMPDEKTTLHFIVSLVIKNCYESLISVAQRSKGNRLPIRVNFLLDEFSNLPKIPDMSAMISAARSRNIRFYLIIQGMHQLISRYGDEAQTIRGNCNNWVFLTSRELELLKELESLCGVSRRTGNALISVSQLQRLDKQTGETLILCERHYPYISNMADIDDYSFGQFRPVPLPTIKPKNTKPINPNKLANDIELKMQSDESDPLTKYASIRRRFS